MPAHIFQVSEENYKVCIDKGIVGLPDTDKPDVFDAILSRLAGVKEGDYVLLYVVKSKELYGVWQIEGSPFYEETPIWSDRYYPLRCKIKWSKYNFESPLSLDDINDLRSSGRIWTWALKRVNSNSSNSMFSISDAEFSVLLSEFMKINPFTMRRGVINNPYGYHKQDICKYLHFQNDDEPKFESTIMALLNSEFAKGSYMEGIFGNYSEYLSYVPTSLGKEMDFLLIFDNPYSAGQVMSYDIIEVKRDTFKVDALKQLIGYESWFLRKKVSGDYKMVRTTAIAKSFSTDVVDYVTKREQIEKKRIKLLRYSYNDGSLKLTDISKT